MLGGALLASLGIGAGAEPVLLPEPVLAPELAPPALLASLQPTNPTAATTKVVTTATSNSLAAQ